MSIFGQIKQDANVEQQKDVVAGSGFQPLESNLYKAKIEMAYVKPAQSGALGVTIKFNVSEKGKDKPTPFTQTFYVTKRPTQAQKDAGELGDTFYVSNDKKYNLAGFNHVNDLTNLLLGLSLTEVNTEDKTVKIYNSAEQKELEEIVPVMTGLIGKDLALAIIKVRTNKSEKQGNTYVPTAEERVFNEVDKFLTPEGFTSLEKTHGLSEPEFANKWLDKWKDQTKDQYKEVVGSTSGGSPNPAKKSATLAIG